VIAFTVMFVTMVITFTTLAFAAMVIFRRSVFIVLMRLAGTRMLDGSGCVGTPRDTFMRMVPTAAQGRVEHQHEDRDLGYWETHDAL
jgi:hypothetical protein